MLSSRNSRPTRKVYEDNLIVAMQMLESIADELDSLSSYGTPPEHVYAVGPMQRLELVRALRTVQGVLIPL